MKLNEKVQHALDESRMLVLGVQVLLGFGFQAFLMDAYAELPRSARTTMLVSLCLLLVSMMLVLAPVARHRLVDSGRDTPHLDGFARGATNLALLPFALALGGDFYVVGCRVGRGSFPFILGAATSLTALSAWYVVPRLLRRNAPLVEDRMDETTLNDRIRHVLTEARVVLPGTQALLGFQFAAVLEAGFDPLPATSKVLHVAALVCLGASVVFLLLPTAYHRIAERGEISERLHSFSSACILLAMLSLGVALAADTFIVVAKATGDLGLALGLAVGWFCLSAATWFGLMLVVRWRHRRRPDRAVVPASGPQARLVR